jgi:hypothetical protein
MSLRPSNAPPIQDMPPPGGYKKVSAIILPSQAQEQTIICVDWWKSTTDQRSLNDALSSSLT